MVTRPFCKPRISQLVTGAVGGLLIVCCAQCSGLDDGHQAFVVRDSAGIAIVESVGSGVGKNAHGLRIAAKPTLQVGGADTEAFVLDGVVDALVVADSLVVVASGGSGEIAFFGTDGDWRYSVGRIGGGPAEFNRLSALGILADGRLAAFDSGHKRISVFENTGELVRTVALATALQGEVVVAIGWLESGTLVVRATTTEGTMAQQGQWRRLDTMAEVLLVDESGLPFGRSMRVQGDQSMSMLTAQSGNEYSFIGLPNLFLRFFVGSARGARVAVGQTDRDEVTIADSNGEVVQLLRRSGRLRELTGKMIDRWVDFRIGRMSNEDTKREYRQLYEKMPFPSTLPAFRSVVLDEDGARLWIEEFELDVIMSGREARWSVYAEDGRFLGEVMMPARVQPLRIGKDYLLGLWRDELGVEYVRLYGIDGA